MPLDDFYKHPQMGDGHLNKCKQCAKEDIHKTRRDNIDYYRAYDRKHALENQERRAKHNADSIRRNKEYKQVKSAYSKVQRAVLSGKLIKLPCEVCGGKAEAHHDDYSKPLDVRWFCKLHHEEYHHKYKKSS
jgi:hypothetical protein